MNITKHKTRHAEWIPRLSGRAPISKLSLLQTNMIFRLCPPTKAGRDVSKHLRALRYTHPPMGKGAINNNYNNINKIQKLHWCPLSHWGRALSMTCFSGLLFGAFLPTALASDLTYQLNEQTYILQPQKTWQEFVEVPTFRGRELKLEEGDDIPEGVTMKNITRWNIEKIAASLEELIGEKINREAGKVTINRGAEGNITFDGIGLTGRRLDTELAAQMTLKALEEGVSIIQLPVEETNPEIIVDDEELKKAGITELITIGESDYSGSPPNRIHNIGVGLSAFDGHILKPDEEFSFNTLLGPVNDQNNYREELTIMGEKTLPAFGGGLCQVSTTAFRGAWLAGFPITRRRNHSYAVRYYAPEGTDATIFPPWTDFKFVNDTENDILIQTHTEDDKAYFFYYGTKPEKRSVEFVGPFIWDIKQPPEDKIEYTAALKPGETRVVSRRVPGMKTMWYRYISDSDEEREPEDFFSWYESRPYFEERGIDVVPSDLFKIPEKDEEVIKISEDTKITIPRRGAKIRIRRD